MPSVAAGSTVLPSSPYPLSEPHAEAKFSFASSLKTHSSTRSHLAARTLLGLCHRCASHCVPPSQESTYRRPCTPALPPSRSPILSCHPPCGGPKRCCTIRSIRQEDVTSVGHPQPWTTSTSSAPASWCSLTQSSGASTPHPSQHHRFPICCFFCGCLAVDSHLWPFSGPAAATKASASTLCTSLTTSLAPATNGLTPHQRCPPSDGRHWRKSYPDELPTPLASQINSPCRPIALATAPAPPHRRASPDLAGAAAGHRGEQALLFPLVGYQTKSWLALRRGRLEATVGLAQMHSSSSQFSIDLI
jgi:hypothetical protein